MLRRRLPAASSCVCKSGRTLGFAPGVGCIPSLLLSNGRDDPEPILNITQHRHLRDKTCQRAGLTSPPRQPGIRVKNLRIHVQISCEIERSETATYRPSGAFITRRRDESRTFYVRDDSNCYR